MSYIIAGLGNPGEEYKDTRHNTGRMMLYALAKSLGVAEADFKADKKVKALVADVEIGKGKSAEKAKLIAPETFMNNSGKAIGPFVTSNAAGVTKASPKKAEQLIVIYPGDRSFSLSANVRVVPARRLTELRLH